MLPDNQINPQPGGVVPPQPPAPVDQVSAPQPASFGPVPVAPAAADPVAAPAPQPMNNLNGPVSPVPTPAVPMPVAPAAADPVAAPAPQPMPPQPVVSAVPQPASGGVFVGGSMPAGNMPMAAPAMMPSGSGSTRKLVKIAVIAVVAVAILGGLAFGGLILLKSMGKVKYAAKDLTVAKTANYSVSYPKQWQDVTSNKAAQESLFGKDFTTDQPDDLKVYAYGLSKNNKYAQSVVAVGSADAGISDSDFKAGINQPGVKDQFEQLVKEGISKDESDSTCQSQSDKKDNFAYNTGDFLVTYTHAYECVQTDAVQKDTGTKQVHRLEMAGLKNGRFYIMAFETIDQDWTRNQTFYEQDMFPAYKPL